MPDQSIHGSVIILKSLPTFPEGVILADFADNVDPFDIARLEIAGTAMGANGDMASWKTANPIEITFGVMANSLSHFALSKLLENNRAAKLKLPIRDVISVTRIDPNGGVVSFLKGKIVSGDPMSSYSSEGRVKNPTYTIRFADMKQTAPPFAALLG